MARVKIDLPPSFHFTARIAVRITDINYGGHVGNDALLALLQEARLQYLGQWGYTELSLAGAGLIMADALLVFKAESFYGDTWNIQVQATDFSRIGFDLYYLVETERNGQRIRIAEAKTGMVCFDYTTRKPVAVPATFLTQAQG